MAIKRTNKTYLLLFLILLLAAFLRFWRLPEMANYDFDQEYASNFAYSVIKEFPVQLIGQGLSIQGLFMGPFYFYYLVPFFVAFGLHPLGGFVGSIIWSLAIIVVYYLVAANIFGKSAGVIAAFLRLILYTELNNDWNMAPVYAAELLIITTWWCFYKIWKGNTRWLLLLGFVFGLYTSIHPILFPFYLIFLVLVIVKRKLPNFKIILLSIILFLIPVLPLLLFEYLHKFLEIKQLVSFFSGASQEPVNFSRFLTYLNLISHEPARILGFQFIPNTVFLTIFLLVISPLIILKVNFWKENFHLAMIFVTFIVFLTYYTFFPGHVPEYYFLALTTLIIFYMSALLGFLIRKKLLFFILILILTNITATNFQKLINYKWRNPSLITLFHKDFIVRQIVKRQPKGQEFYVSYISNLGWNFGFDYLFKYYGRQPQTREVKQPIYTIVLPKSLSPASIDISSGDVGLILPE